MCPEGFEETEDACVQTAEGGEWRKAGDGMGCPTPLRAGTTQVLSVRGHTEEGLLSGFR